MADGVEANRHAGVGERTYVLDAHRWQRGGRLELSNERVGAAYASELLQRSAAMTDAAACFFESDLRHGLLQARPPVGAEAVQRASREEEGRVHSQLPENRQCIPHMAGVVIVERHKIGR